MLKEIVIAFQSYFSAHQFISRNKLWRWIALPGIVYALVFMVSMYFFGKTSTWFIELISFKLGLVEWLENKGEFLRLLFAFSGLMLWVIQMLLYFSLFKYICLILGSPAFAYLSEKTEAILNGQDSKVDFQKLNKDAKRGVNIALRNVVSQTKYLLILLLVSIIPIVGWITPLIAALLECRFYGYSMIDYNNERRNMDIERSVVFAQEHNGLATGNGIGFYLMHLVPFVGWVLAPAYAIVAATLSMRRMD